MLMRFEKLFCNPSIFKYRYWCSTKVDNDLEHIAGQGNWGFCRQSCPPTLRPITTTATEVFEVSETTSRGDFFQLHYDFKRLLYLIFFPIDILSYDFVKWFQSSDLFVFKRLFF